jgi:APA family basic amino acid/polyamine antiporter
VLTLTAIYVGVNVSYYATMSSAEMADPAMKKTAVATEVCFRLLGPVGKVVASLILMTSVLGSLNGNILVAPRLLYAMAEDKLAPGALKKVHPVYKTPIPATVAYSAWACLLVLGLGSLTVYRLPPLAVGGTEIDLNLPAGKVPFDLLTDYAVFGALVFETLAVCSIFVFRRRSARDGAPPPPYRTPGYPVLVVVYTLVMAFVAVNMLLSKQQRFEAVVGLGFIAVGGAVYAVIAAAQGRPAARP